MCYSISIVVQIDGKAIGRILDGDSAREVPPALIHPGGNPRANRWFL